MHPFLGLWKKKEVLFRMNIKKNGGSLSFYILFITSGFDKYLDFHYK